MRLLIAAALIFFTGNTLAEVNFTGYAMSFAVAQDELDNEVIEADEVYQSQNALRLMWEGFSDRLVWQMHYELSPVLVSRDITGQLPTFSVVSDSYRLTDIEPTLLGENSKQQIYQNLDRFNVQIRLNAGDLTIGRQAIAFGSARVINPTDIFLPFDVRTFNTEYRIGVDAIRFQRPWGELGEIDIGLVLGDDARPETSAAFVQIRTNHEAVDYHLAIVEYARQSMLGVGLQRAMGDLGFWFESAYVDGDEDYLRLSTGVDYAFSEHTFAQIEYHYNGAGSDSPDNYLDSLTTLPYEQGGIFLLGEHYLIPAFTYQVSPLWFISTQAIVNLSDHSAFVSFSAEYNIAENLYMDFGYYHFQGDDLSLDQAGTPTLGSEYGTNPDTLYLSIRYYF